MEQKAWIIDEKTAKQYLTVEDAIDCAATMAERIRVVPRDHSSLDE